MKLCGRSETARERDGGWGGGGRVCGVDGVERRADAAS
jgi:hypothetical protein